MRVLGIDVGARRIGLAISDPSRTLARPLTTLAVANPSDAIVVGLPSRLDGTPTDATPAVVAFIDALKTRTMMPVETEGERLTSHEADQRLAATERDWRKRKQTLDAAAAAIILQDFLDRRQA